MATIGSKNGSGVYQRIIGWMPPHDLYVEPFAGSGAIFEHKRRAGHSVLIDSNPDVVACLDATIPDRRSHTAAGDGDRRSHTAAGDGATRSPTVELVTGDGLAWLRHFRPAEDLRVLVYCDPPYWRDARRDPKADYYGEHEWDEAMHVALLNLLWGAPWNWLLSGYPSELYESMLSTTEVERFQVSTRGGPATECLWANYARPDRLHDPRFAGADYDQRWTMSKRQRRWVRMLSAMPPRERWAMLDVLNAHFPTAKADE